MRGRAAFEVDLALLDQPEAVARSDGNQFDRKALVVQFVADRIDDPQRQVVGVAHHVSYNFV